MDKSNQQHNSTHTVQFSEPTINITFETAFITCEKLIYSIANKFTLKIELQRELIQEGYLGLHRAVDLFDLKYNVKFSTFAYRYIAGFMQKHLIRVKKYREVSTEFNEETLITDTPDFSRNIDVSIIKNRFNLLTEKQKLIMDLYFTQDFSVQEIADKLSITKQRVSAVINQEIKNIKTNLN